MAFNTDGLAKIYTEIQYRCIAIKKQVDGLISSINANANTSSTLVIQMYESLGSTRTYLQSVQSTPGLDQYAKDQSNDPAYDTTAEYTAMLNEFTSCINWIETNYPTDGSGYLLREIFNGGSLDERLFTQAQLAGFVTALTSLSNTIA